MATLTFDDARLLLSSRAYIYELAHTVFCGEPDEQLVKALTGEFAEQALRFASDEPCDAYDRFRSCLANLAKAPSVQAAVADLKSSYMKLIEGPDASDAFPWESMYVSHRRLLFQRSTLEVREAYREFGYELQERGKVPDDHLSLECAFMAEMARRTFASFTAWLEAADESVRSDGADEPAAASDSLDALLAGQERFLSDHALKWFSLYARDLQEADGESLYAHAACMIAEFAGDDLQMIAAIRSMTAERGAA